MEHHGKVGEQFGARASAYLTSATHAEGADLAALSQLAAEHGAGKSVLDLGCGGGHVSYAMAPHAGEVVAYDLSADMLAVVAGEAQARGLDNIRTQEGRVESLPFPDDHFALIASRYSAHHWSDPAAALAEAARVLAPGGLLCIIDVVGPQGPHQALLDTHLQALELLRDPSHMRDYSRAEWHDMLADSGFAVTGEEDWRLEINFASWIERMQTPPVMEAALRKLLSEAPVEVRQHYRIAPETLDFAFETAMFQARLA